MTSASPPPPPQALPQAISISPTPAAATALCLDEEPELTEEKSTLTDLSGQPRNSTFDYLYEFSETRKVLEEFFKCPTNEEGDKVMLENGSDVDSIVSLKINIEIDCDRC